MNAYIEATKGGPEQAARTARPGLDTLYTLGTGPIQRQYQNPGLFNGDLFTISGGSLYRNSTLIGDVGYSAQPRMAAAQNQLAIVSGGGLYVYNGTSLTQQIYFDDGASRLPLFSGVAVLFNIFVYPVIGSTEFFFSQVGSASQINAANFSNAQTSPDPIVEVAVLAEELMFFKSVGMEWWDFTGALTAPFQEAQGRTYIRGCAAQGSVVRLDNAMFWVADDYSVYRSSNIPLKVSTPYIDDRLRHANAGVNQATAFTLSIEGHVFYVLNLPTINESYAYDCQTQEWAQWGTNQSLLPEPGLFCAATAAGQGSTIYLGSATDGTVWTLNPSSNLDGSITKRVVVSGAHYMTEGTMRCNTISLHCVRGVGDAAAPNPIVEMRFSDDGGRTWSSWLQGDLGMVGQYLYKPTWRALGTMQQPGRNFEFAVSDPVNFTVEGASINSARV